LCSAPRFDQSSFIEQNAIEKKYYNLLRIEITCCVHVYKKHRPINSDINNLSQF